MIIGPENPLAERGGPMTEEDLARADSLKAIELVLEQDIEGLKKNIDVLNGKKSVLSRQTDSLNNAINSSNAVAAQLKDQIDELSGKKDMESQARMKKIAGLVAGLPVQTIKELSERLNLGILTRLVSSTSAQNAKTILTAIDPRTAADITKKMATTNK